MTSNGSINLECHQFKLLFSRRQEAIPSPTSPPAPGPSKPSWKCLGSLTPAPEPDDGTRLVATLVAIDERGVIKVKIEPQDAGRDVPEAFRAFKREVELRLERLLRDVPDGGGKAPGHAVDNGRATVQRDREMVQPTVRRADRDLADAPPAYGDVKKG